MLKKVCYLCHEDYDVLYDEQLCNDSNPLFSSTLGQDLSMNHKSAIRYANEIDTHLQNSNLTSIVLDYLLRAREINLILSKPVEKVLCLSTNCGFHSWDDSPCEKLYFQRSEYKNGFLKLKVFTNRAHESILALFHDHMNPIHSLLFLVPNTVFLSKLVSFLMAPEDVGSIQTGYKPVFYYKQAMLEFLHELTTSSISKPTVKTREMFDYFKHIQIHDVKTNNFHISAHHGWSLRKSIVTTKLEEYSLRFIYYNVIYKDSSKTNFIFSHWC